MTPDLLSLVAAGTVIALCLAVLLGYWLARREAGPTVARLVGEIDRAQRRLDLEAAANDRLAALVPRTIKFRLDPVGDHPATLEINGVTITPRRALEARDEILQGRVAIAVQIEAGDWPVDELLAAAPADVGPFATAGLARLRGLLAQELATDESAERPIQEPAQPVS